MAFNPNEHLMKLQNKEYLEVKWRLVWFRDLFPNGTIETEMLHLDLDREVTAEVMVWNNDLKRKEKVVKTAKGYCVFRATIKNGEGGIGTGTKSESAVDFADFIEKAESGAIGRALATLGYGTQFTGDELNEGERIVDSPVDRAPSASAPSQPARSAPASPEARPAPHSQTTPARSFQPISAAPHPQQTQANPTEQQPAQAQPRPVTLTILKAGANRNYPKGEHASGWDALKEKIAEEFNILGEVTDELIASDYNLDAQAFVRDAMKQPVAKAS